MNSDRTYNIKSQVKRHIPKGWLSELRITYRVIMEAVNDIRRTGLVMNFIIITLIAAILTIFGALFRTAISSTKLANSLENVLEISVYVKPNVDAKLVKEQIEQIKEVKRITLIPKEKSWKEFQGTLGIAMTENPLPDVLRVKVKKPADTIPVLNKIKSTCTGVEDVGYAKELGQKVQFITHIINMTAVVSVIVVALLTITIINNTIQLVIQSRKEEIEIMRLMGVSNRYIRVPFILQGAFYGCVAGFIAIIPLNVVQGVLLKVHTFAMVPSPPLAQNFVIAALMIIGIVFGAGGSWLSIKKHLQV